MDVAAGPDAARRPFYFGTNTKMHQLPHESARFVANLAVGLAREGGSAGVQPFVIPPFTSLPAAVAAAADTGIWIGAQNAHWATEGAFTGEISPAMIRAVGAELVLLGHAERRRFFGETDAALALKTPAVLAAGLRILLCVGETAAERAAGIGPETAVRQLGIALADVPTESVDRLLIAYEPVWAIGEGSTPATPDEVAPVVARLRTALTKRFGPSPRVPILYGGSVNAGNAAGFARLNDVDGLFVGRAAWTAAGFLDVLRAAW